MLYGTVRMSPRFGAKAKSMNDAEALKVKGVLKVVPLDTNTGSGFGVIAQNTWAAFKGAEALQIEWEDPKGLAGSDAIFAAMREQLAKPADFTLRDDGDVTTAFADAPREDVIEAQYQAPFLAHACMEPMNATAQWRDGRLHIWAPNQSPAILQMICAPLVGVEAKDVTVHTTLLGGGFGRRAEPDFPVYAVELAKLTEGRPVKVIWTREEDMRHDAYRPAAVARMKARIAKGEGPVAIDMAIAAPSLMASVLRRTFPSIPAMGPDKTLTEGAHDQPLTIANYRVSGHKIDTGIPVGFWRSVGYSYNGFFHESFLDEVAKASGVDPLDMRLKLMAGYPARCGSAEESCRDVRLGPRSGCGQGPWHCAHAVVRHVGGAGGASLCVAGRHAHREGLVRRRNWAGAGSLDHQGADDVGHRLRPLLGDRTRRSPLRTARSSSRTSPTSTPCA